MPNADSSVVRISDSVSPEAMRFFILTPAHEIIETNEKAWAEWFENSSEGVVEVAEDRIGSFTISTIFVGLEKDDAKELRLWETMIFDDSIAELDPPRVRCSGTWEDAERMHHEVFCKVRESEQQS